MNEVIQGIADFAFSGIRDAYGLRRVSVGSRGLGSISHCKALP